jgi:hypothetical protein
MTSADKTSTNLCRIHHLRPSSEDLRCQTLRIVTPADFTGILTPLLLLRKVGIAIKNAKLPELRVELAISIAWIDRILWPISEACL